MQDTYDVVVFYPREYFREHTPINDYCQDHDIKLIWINTEEFIRLSETEKSECLLPLKTARCVIFINHEEYFYSSIVETRRWLEYNAQNIFDRIPEKSLLTVFMINDINDPILGPNTNIYHIDLPGHRLDGFLDAVRRVVKEGETHLSFPREISELEDLPEGALPPSPKISRSDKVPADLEQHLGELEEWALANKTDARKDTLAFWALKLPAIFASAGAGVLAHFNLTTVSVVAGAIASVCVIVDGLHPRGMLRNVHLRAYHDIRNLTTQMVAAWRSRSPRANPETTARRIIGDAESERRRIAAYIRDAETALNIKTEEAAGGRPTGS